MKKTRDKLAQYLGLRIRLLKLHISLHKATIFLKKKKKELLSVIVQWGCWPQLLQKPTYTSSVPLTTYPSDECIGVVELHLTLFALRWHQSFRTNHGSAERRSDLLSLGGLVCPCCQDLPRVSSASPLAHTQRSIARWSRQQWRPGRGPTYWY